MGARTAIAAIAVGAWIAFAGVAGAQTPRWTGGVLLDEPFRDFVRLRSIPDQELASDASDVLLGVTVISVDAISATIAPLVHDREQLALDAQFAYLSALAVSLALGEALRREIGRARPYARECAIDPRRHRCDADDLALSFYSLHAAMAFTSAGFACAMHVDHGLLDDPGWDAVACATASVLATGVALLRTMADRHYLTDVVVGALVGLAIGIVAPFLLVRADDVDVARGRL